MEAGRREGGLAHQGLRNPGGAMADDLRAGPWWTRADVSSTRVLYAGVVLRVANDEV